MFSKMIKRKGDFPQKWVKTSAILENCPNFLRTFFLHVGVDFSLFVDKSYKIEGPKVTFSPLQSA